MFTRLQLKYKTTYIGKNLGDMCVFADGLLCEHETQNDEILAQSPPFLYAEHEVQEFLVLFICLLFPCSLQNLFYFFQDLRISILAIFLLRLISVYNF